MTIPTIPDTPFAEPEPHWRPWLDALESWRPSVNVLRPQLHQPAGDRALVRSRLAEHPDVLSRLQNAAESAMEGALPTPESGLRAGASLPAKAIACADWWLLSSDERFAERAWEIARSMMSWPRWVADEHLPLTIDLKSAAAIGALGNILDRMDDWLSIEQRSELVSCLLRRGIEPFVSISEAHSEWWTYSLHNWRTVIGGSYGIAALSLADQMPQELLRRAIKHSVIGTLSVLDQGDVDGGWFEGVSYWKYGIGEAVQFMDVLQRVTGGAVDLFSHPYLTKTGDFCLYETWTDGRVHDWGDCGSRVNASALMARLARANQRSDWQAYVRRFPPPVSLETLFWEDCDLPATEYSELPRVKRFRGIEVAVLRAGWGDDDAVLAVKAGKTTANHSHLDMGSFVITAGNHDLVADGGHWSYAHSLGFFDLDFPNGTRWDFPGLATECHSTVLVDGQGQRYGDEHDATIVACADYEDYAFVTMDVTRAYPQLTRFVRYVLLIRPDTVVIVDDLAAPERRRFGWRVVLPGEVTSETSPTTWTTIAPDAATSLSIECLLPAEKDGFLSDLNNLSASYPSTGGHARHTCRTLTFSNLVRSTQQQFAVAMRIGRDVSAKPQITATPVYRGLRVETTSGDKQAWAIMWGEPGVGRIEIE